MPRSPGSGWTAGLDGTRGSQRFAAGKLARAHFPRGRKRLEPFCCRSWWTLCRNVALRLPDGCLGQLFVAPDYKGRGLGKQLLAFARERMPNEIWLRCVRENEKAWRWYEREGFVFEREEVNPITGFMMKIYRWKRQETAQ